MLAYQDHGPGLIPSNGRIPVSNQCGTWCNSAFYLVLDNVQNSLGSKGGEVGNWLSYFIML